MIMETIKAQSEHTKKCRKYRPTSVLQPLFILSTMYTTPTAFSCELSLQLLNTEHEQWISIIPFPCYLKRVLAEENLPLITNQISFHEDRTLLTSFAFKQNIVFCILQSLQCKACSVSPATIFRPNFASKVLLHRQPCRLEVNSAMETKRHISLVQSS